MAKVLRTTDEVLDALGGDEVVSEWLGCPLDQVRRWREHSIATGVQLRIWLELEDRGIRVDRSVFGLWPSIASMQAERAAEATRQRTLKRPG